MKKKLNENLYGINIQSENFPNGAQMGAIVKGKFVFGFENINDEDLNVLVSLSVSMNNMLTEEYFRRNPKQKEEMERFEQFMSRQQQQGN